MTTMRERFDEKFDNDEFPFLDKGILEPLLSFIEQEIKKEREDIVEMVESLPAYTPLSDKTMSKVSDEAKKPRWGSNYLNREKVINIIKKRV